MQRLKPSDEDAEWLKGNLISLCAELGTGIKNDLGKDNQLVIRL